MSSLLQENEADRLSFKANKSYHSLLAGKSRSGLTREQEDCIALWKTHPWEFFKGKYQEKPIYWTRDEKSSTSEGKVKPFPGHEPGWEYIKFVLDEILELGQDPHDNLLAVNKPRQMWFSHAVLGFALWECLFEEATNWLVSKNKEDGAVRIMREKILFPYSKLPDWFRQSFPINDTQREYHFAKTDSYITGVAQNFYRSEALGVSGNIVIDEAWSQDEVQAGVEESLPMARRVILLGTPGLGGPATEYGRALIEGDEFEEEPEGPVIPADGGLLS